MKNILVVGMGRFGQHLAQKLLERKNDVLVIDNNAELIESIAPRFPDVQIGDCTNIDVLRSLGVNNFDICFVAIGENFQSSLEITSLLKELGAKYVISKANKDIQAKFLLRNGADEVVYPERDTAEKLAIQHSAKNMFDYVELTPEFSIFELPILDGWSGKTIGTINVRRKYNLNILAIKNGGKLMPLPGADYEFRPGDHVMVVGSLENAYKFAART